MKPMEVMLDDTDSSESGKKNQRPSRILSSLRRNVNVFRSATGTGGDETRPLTASMSGGAHGTTGGIGGGIGLLGASSQQAGTNSSDNKLPHGHAVPTHTKSKFEIYSVRDRRDATAKRAFKVQVPKRMLYYTILVFLVLPLALFLWKEMHLDNHANHDPATHDLVKSNMRVRGHDVYPTWMEDTLHSTVWNDHDAPANEIVGSHTTAPATDAADTANDTEPADQPHQSHSHSHGNDIGENDGAWDEVVTDHSSNSNGNSTSGLPDDMVDPDSSSLLGSVLSSTETISATNTGIESDHAKEQKTDSIDSSRDTTTTITSVSVDGDDDDAGGTENHDATLQLRGGAGDAGTSTGTKLSSESAVDLLGASLDSLVKQRLGGGGNKLSKDDDDGPVR
jgi:hypothetical protein